MIANAGTEDTCTTPVLLTNASLDFRAMLTNASIGTSGELIIQEATMDLMNLKPGSQAMYLKLATK